jgi:hypothetical protein
MKGTPVQNPQNLQNPVSAGRFAGFAGFASEGPRETRVSSTVVDEHGRAQEVARKGIF